MCTLDGKDCNTLEKFHLEIQLLFALCGQFGEKMNNCTFDGVEQPTIQIESLFLRPLYWLSTTVGWASIPPVVDFVDRLNLTFVSLYETVLYNPCLLEFLLFLLKFIDAACSAKDMPM